MARNSYFEHEIAIRHNVSVPSSIKCSRCNIVKGSTAFSNKRLAELKSKIALNPRFNAAIQAVIPCSGCTGGQRLEQVCSMCAKSKGTDTGFSKSQLKKGDDAICIKCSNERNAMGPAGGDRATGEENELKGQGDSDDSESDDDGTTWASSTGGHSYTAGSTFPSGSGVTTIGGGVSLPSSARSETSTWATVTRRPQGLPSTFNPNAYRKPVNSASSVAGTTRSRNSGFAKIRKTQPYSRFDVPDNKVASEQQDDEDEEIIHSESE